MNKYWIQINDTMSPAMVELTAEELKGVVKALKAINHSDPTALINLSDVDSNDIYDNYNSWIKAQKENRQ